LKNRLKKKKEVDRAVRNLMSLRSSWSLKETTRAL